MKLKMLLFGSLFFYSFISWANIDATCFRGDCLKFGWQLTNQITGEVKSLHCKNDDCINSGWTFESRYRVEAEAFCHSGGCFNEGWELYSMPSQRFVSESVCHNSAAGVRDCLSNGWSTHQSGRATVKTICIRQDCKNYGWEIKAPGFRSQSVRCKPGGCFQDGWTVY